MEEQKYLDCLMLNLKNCATYLCIGKNAQLIANKEDFDFLCYLMNETIDYADKKVYNRVWGFLSLMEKQLIEYDLSAIGYTPFYLIQFDLGYYDLSEEKLSEIGEKYLEIAKEAMDAIADEKIEEFCEKYLSSTKDVVDYFKVAPYSE